jgi:hypothetical protein
LPNCCTAMSTQCLRNSFQHTLPLRLRVSAF